MLIDSHCHLNGLDLAEFDNDLGVVLAEAADEGVHELLSVCVELSDYSDLERLAAIYPQVKISVGVHPNIEMACQVTSEMLCEKAVNPACVAIGETGLDYYRVHEAKAQEEQRQRFRAHINAANKTKKPLIVHTRQAIEDTLKVMGEERADQVGGVMHCFAENLEMAKKAIDLNFYISFSGILTFKSATSLQDVARQIPLESILIETDSPYLAPVPFRGKQNHPALVKYVAKALAELRGISFEEVAEVTSHNFYRCFNLNQCE